MQQSHGLFATTKLVVSFDMVQYITGYRSVFEHICFAYLLYYFVSTFTVCRCRWNVLVTTALWLSVRTTFRYRGLRIRMFCCRAFTKTWSCGDDDHSA